MATGTRKTSTSGDASLTKATAILGSRKCTNFQSCYPAVTSSRLIGNLVILDGNPKKASF